MQSNIESTLAKLIAFPSTTDNPEACRDIIEHVHAQLADLGLFVTKGTYKTSPWLIATTQPTEHPDIMLAAHLDVVPASRESSFVMHTDGDTLRGRGVYDMKFAAAAYIEFAKAHAALLPTLNIGFLFTTDEETGGASVIQLLKDGWRANCVFLPDGSSDWQLEVRAKGLYGATLSAAGKAAHSSRPWEGENALHRLLDIAHTLRSEYPLGEKSDATLSITGAEGGKAVNQVVEQASMRLDFRSFDPIQLRAFENRVLTLADQHAATIDVLYHGLPVALDTKHPYVRRFLDILQDTTGKEPLLDESYGGSDARHFAQYDIPCIIIEPHGGGRHGDEEWIRASDLDTYYRMMERWILSKQQ
jgi:acetylornithine deacetylase/succinyl-diaminopimelate desuccinylase-like protein